MAARARLMQACPRAARWAPSRPGRTNWQKPWKPCRGRARGGQRAHGGGGLRRRRGRGATAGDLREQGRRVRRLRVSHAFHSARMDPVLAELGQVAAGLEHRARWWPGPGPARARC
ncbi:hypothetical protein GXW82_03380 [Streptacidiphilus sp. 4-A2]|nr:hypothetical protein [Streptacidiphilus sp. 4-A2]